ncbi:MAG: hypothetical protein KF722_06040 [Nitrospira sp.]|nr:hypothetical protein [Nitrospira sp.]
MSRVPAPAVPIKPSARKAAARGQLERLGLKVSDGHDYRLEDALLPGITSTQAREALKAVSGSLAQTIVDERQRA